MSEPATTAPSPAGAGSPTDDVLRWGRRQMVEEVAAVRGAGGGAARWRGRHNSARAQEAGVRVGGEGMEDGKARRRGAEEGAVKEGAVRRGAFFSRCERPTTCGGAADAREVNVRSLWWKVRPKNFSTSYFLGVEIYKKSLLCA
jgi:hypothetical protein